MSLSQIKGLGKKRIELLNKLNITNIYDLVFFKPNYYEDRKTLYNLQNYNLESSALYKVKIVTGPIRNVSKKNLKYIIYNAEDAYRSIEIIFFNLPWISNFIKIGRSYYIFGQIKKNGNKLQITNPMITENLNNDIGEIVPIYPLTKGITQKVIRDSVYQALKFVDLNLSLPKTIRDKYNLPDTLTILKFLHFPSDINQAKTAMQAMKYLESFIFNMMITNNGHFSKKQDGIIIKASEIEDKFIKCLPFSLTDDQINVINKIKEELESENIMKLLVQGDVGSGKTIVSQYACLKTAYTGYQVAFMSPTNILAEQNYNKTKLFLDRFNITHAYISSKTSNKEKSKIIDQVREGKIKCLFGTHALISDKVKFNNLGLLIIDEQHRFGVKQRNKILEENKYSNLLVMSATPIPRTLALIIYGELDMAEIHQMPNGRKPIKTYLVTKSDEQKIFEFVKNQIELGRQAYFVCPLIEESAKLDLISATEYFKKIKDEFKNLNVALLTGKTSEEDKDGVMSKFRDGDIHILVSTTVIEVGVDVPNASVIVILDAHRFGLSQLHQLRGRVGRGQYESYAILLSDNLNTNTFTRLKIMESTTDGFKISEEDLKFRGPGELLGSQQHGIPKLKFLDMKNDFNLLLQSKKDIIEYSKYFSDEEIIKIEELKEVLFNSNTTGVLN